MRVALLFSVCSMLCLAFATPSTAGNSGSRLTDAKGIQSGALAAPDGSGGVICAWNDDRLGSARIFAQLIDSTGAKHWATDGVQVTTFGSNIALFAVVEDGSGGAWVLYYCTGAVEPFAVRAQHLSPTGASLLGSTDGLLRESLRSQNKIAAFADGAGGVIACIYESTVAGCGYPLVLHFIQKLNTLGQPEWGTGGISAVTLPSDCYVFQGAACTDWQGGCFVATPIYGSPRGGGRVQHYDASGVPTIPGGGVFCSSLEVNGIQTLLAPGSPGNAYVVSYSSDGHYRANRVYSDGTLGWGTQGVDISNAGSPTPSGVASRIDGGFFLLGTAAYVRMIDSTGVPLWTPPRQLPLSGSPNYDRLAASPDGSLWVGWYDYRDGDPNVYIQHFAPDGTSLLTLGGTPLCQAPGGQYLSALVPVGLRVFAFWDDSRRSLDADVFHQIVLPDGGFVLPDADAPQIRAARDVPNDQGGHIALGWARSGFDDPAIRGITGYRIWRRLPIGASPVSVTTGVGPVEAAAVRTVSALPGTYWEPMATIPAQQLPGYGLVVETTQDSLPGANPYTAFFVSALTSSPFVFFDSQIDSAYSIDNLSPPTPVPFHATYMASQVQLHWIASAARDFKEFRLYRDPVPTFVPGPGNQILAGPDTAFVDTSPGATAFTYKLAAVDIHGNASRFAAVSPNNPVATLAALVSVGMDESGVNLVWFSSAGVGLSAKVFRRNAVDSDWQELTSLSTDGTGFFRYTDAAAEPGRTYDYRLGIFEAGVLGYYGETSFTVPLLALAIANLSPNPVGADGAALRLSLASRTPVDIEVLDVAGRIQARQEFVPSSLGIATVRLTSLGAIRPGVYLMRVKQDGHQVTRRFVVAR